MALLLLLLLTLLGHALTQVSITPNGTAFICAAPNATYCADASLAGNIIILCSGTIGHASNCDDRLSPVPPSGVKVSGLCWQTAPDTGDAQCELNGTIYNSNGTTSPVPSAPALSPEGGSSSVITITTTISVSTGLEVLTITGAYSTASVSHVGVGGGTSGSNVLSGIPIATATSVSISTSIATVCPLCNSSSSTVSSSTSLSATAIGSPTSASSTKAFTNPGGSLSTMTILTVSASGASSAVGPATSVVIVTAGGSQSVTGSVTEQSAATGSASGTASMQSVNAAIRQGGAEVMGLAIAMAGALVAI